MTNSMDLPRIIRNNWLANTGVLFFVTEEPHRVWKGLEAAIKELAESRPDDRPVLAIAHDKVSGFHTSDPGVTPPTDKSNVLLNAIPMMVLPREVLSDINSDFNPPFDTAADIIFVLKDPMWDLAESGSKQNAVQIFRNIIQANMASSEFHGTKDTDDPGSPWLRGKRMFILVSANPKLPDGLPELDPIIVPLPDEAMLDQGIQKVIDPLAGQKPVGGTHKLAPLPAEHRARLLAAGKGFTYQKWEDTLSLALVEQGSRVYEDIDGFLGTIESRKVQMLAGIPGVTLVPRGTIAFDHVPGYEQVVQFVNHRRRLSPDLARKHNIKTLKGMSLIGVPGTGKTLFSKYLGRLLGKDVLFVSLGELKGSFVGQSQAQLRRALTAAKALGAVTVLDDADKGSMGSTASGYSGDGGTSQEMIQMLLTEMDGLDDDSGCVFVFTMNRVANCPPELLRPGRMDELWYVERPCPATRLSIMQVHLAHHKFTADDEAKLETLAGDKFTDDWVGAELAKLITDGVLEALAEKRDAVSTAFLAKRIGEMTPMANVKTFQEDLRAIEEAAGQFHRVGRLTPKKSATAASPSHGGRAGRPVRV